MRYFADNLGMYSYYGPSTTAGTFGIALLSKYPIVQAATFYLYSTGEQTACIQAVIAANGAFYNVFVTHLGNGGPMVQLIDVLNSGGWRLERDPDGGLQLRAVDAAVHAGVAHAGRRVAGALARRPPAYGPGRGGAHRPDLCLAQRGGARGGIRAGPGIGPPVLVRGDTVRGTDCRFEIVDCRSSADLSAKVRRSGPECPQK